MKKQSFFSVITKHILVLAAIMLHVGLLSAQQIPTKPLLQQQPKTALPKDAKINSNITIVPLPEVDRFIVISTPNLNTNNPYSLHPGQKARISAELTATHSKPVKVNLTYGQSGSTPAIFGPASVTVPAGQQFIQFDVTASQVSSIVAASVGGHVTDPAKVKQKAMLSVRPEGAGCNGKPTISAPSFVRPNSTISITASIPCAAAQPTSVQVTPSNPGVIPPPPGNVITIPAGATSATYTTTTGNIINTTIVTLSAHLPGSSPLNRAIDIQVAVTNSQ